MHTHAQARSLTPNTPFYPITTLLWDIQIFKTCFVQAQWLGPKKGNLGIGDAPKVQGPPGHQPGGKRGRL